MPIIWMPKEELEALRDVLLHNEKVDWDAYDRAKVYLLASPVSVEDAMRREEEETA